MCEFNGIFVPKDAIYLEESKNKHYNLLGDLQAIEVIARSMTREQFYGYCLGNIFKYKLRAGHKENNPAQQDLDKARHYIELFDKYKVLCYDNIK